MPKILEKIAAARSEGDLSENAEYHAQREAQGLLQARINKMKSDLARASIVDPSRLPTDQVTFGATVVERDLDFDMVQKVRQTWQFYRDRRPDMYGDLTRP